MSWSPFISLKIWRFLFLKTEFLNISYLIFLQSNDTPVKICAKENTRRHPLLASPGGVLEERSHVFSHRGLSRRLQPTPGVVLHAVRRVVVGNGESVHLITATADQMTALVVCATVGVVAGYGHPEIAGIVIGS